MKGFSKIAARLGSSHLLILLLLLAPAAAYGQLVNASLSGTVTDPSGAAIAGAKVTATSTANGTTFAAESDTAGNYKLLSLPPGEYKITTEKSGFRTDVMTGIVLRVDESAQVNVRLEIGRTTTSVSVSGAAPLVETATASVGNDIMSTQVVDLPLNTRHYGALALLVPGTVSDNGGFASNSEGSPFSDTVYSANGNRTSSNDYLIDGIPSRGVHFAGFSLQPPPDAVEEFKVQTNVYNAAFGTLAGSTINLVTKSGSNQFHGSAYEFLRNNDLDARNFFSVNQTNPVTKQVEPGTARAELRRNQFGFTFGGPVRKNKTFFFGNYEGFRLVSGQTSLVLVPTDAQKSGNFSSLLTGNVKNLCGASGPANLSYDTGQLFDPGTESSYTCPSGSHVLVGTPIPGNVITNISPSAKIVLGAFPEPNLPLSSANYLNQTPQTQNYNQVDARVDNTFNAKNSLSVRYLYGGSLITAPASIPGFPTVTQFQGQNAALGWTHTFGPSMVNELRLGFDRDDNKVGPPGPRANGFIESFGITGLTAVAPQYEFYPIFSISNFAGVGDYGYAPLHIPSMTEELSDHLTRIHGKHTITVGADMMSWQYLGGSGPNNLQGSFSFNGEYSSLGGETSTLTQSPLADFELGYPSGAQRANGFRKIYEVGGKLWGFFAQDDIRVRSNLTINAGLRWEFREYPVDKNNILMTIAEVAPPFSGTGDLLMVMALPDAQNDAACTNYHYLLSASGECLVASSSERAQLGFTGRTRRSLMNQDWNYFAPRLGVAWQPTHSDKLVVRSGGGIFFDLPNQNAISFGHNNPITSTTLAYTTANGQPPPLTNGAPTTINDVFGTTGVPPVINQTLGSDPFINFVYPAVYEWSLGVQSQLTTNSALDVEYVGNHGIHLDDLRRNFNQPEPGLGAVQPRRPFPDFGTINAMILSDAISSYQALQVEFTRRFSHGLIFMGSYTWQHTLDNNEGEEGFGGGSGNSTPENNNAPLSANYGDAYIDVPQRLSLSYVYQLPVGSGRAFLNHGGVPGAILGGWSVSGITTFQAGFPFSTLGSDYSNTAASFTSFPDRTCGGAGSKVVAQWFNTNCFTDSLLKADLAAGTPRFGNSGRNILTGPDLDDWDFVLFRDIKLKERATLQIRAETFNLFNHANFGLPNSTVTSSLYGHVISANIPRQIQLAAKIIF